MWQRHCWWERRPREDRLKSWSKRQTDRRREGGFLEGDGERGGWGCTWMIVSFVQASSVANGEIAQISSFHVLCFWCGANLSAWPKLKRPIFTSLLFRSLFSFLSSSPLSLWIRGLSKATLTPSCSISAWSFHLVSYNPINHIVSYTHTLCTCCTLFSYLQPHRIIKSAPRFRAPFILPWLFWSPFNFPPFLNCYSCNAFCLSRCPSQTSDCLAFGAVLWCLWQGCGVCLCVWKGSGWEVNTYWSGWMAPGPMPCGRQKHCARGLTAV